MSARVEIAFACRGCGRETVASVTGEARCPACGAENRLDVSGSLRDAQMVDRCSACGGTQLYVQRDFNQKVGLLVVIIGAALAPFTPYYASLVVAALIDACLYVVLPEITICYRCHAHYRGFRRNPQHQSFDLHVAEQYHVQRPPG